MINIIKVVFSDIINLYKNFFHWFFSKFVISIVRYLLAIMFASPFFVVFLIVLFWFIDWRYLLTLLSSGEFWWDLFLFLYSNIVVVIILFVLFLLMMLFLLIWYSYWMVLMLNLNLNYLNWKKLAFWNKSYFDFGFIFKYIKVLWWTMYYLLIPIWIFVIWFLVLFFVFWWTSSINWVVWDNSGIFSKLSFALLVLCSFLFIYLMYRLSFSYIVFLDKKNYPEDKSPIFYVKESFKLTSSFQSLSKLLVIVLLFSIIIIPFRLKNKFIDDEYDSIKTYLIFEQNIKLWREVSEKNIYTYNELKIKYWNLSSNELEREINKYSIYQTLFFVFNYLFIYWIYEMLFVSFYNNYLVENNLRKVINKNFLGRLFTKKKKN